MSATIPRLLSCYQAWKRGKDTPRGFASRLYESQVGKPKRRRAIFLWGSYNSAVEAIGPNAFNGLLDGSIFRVHIPTSWVQPDTTFVNPALDESLLLSQNSYRGLGLGTAQVLALHRSWLGNVGVVTVRSVEDTMALVFTAVTVVVVTMALVSVSVALDGTSTGQPRRFPLESSLRAHARLLQQL